MGIGNQPQSSADPPLRSKGFFRLTRHVIRRFVAEHPKVEKESYDYSLERAGVVSIQMAAQYWIWQPLADPSEARQRLEGLLSLTASVLGREPDAGLVDLRPMLADVERLLPQAAVIHRPALLAIHVLFNLLVGPDQRSRGFEAFLAKYGPEASAPSIEAVIVSTILNAHEDWPLQDHQSVLDLYFTERMRPKGLHAPRLFEAAACLAIAEKYRVTGDVANAKLMIARAVEAHPAQPALRAFEAIYDEQAAIDWRSILLPRDEEPEKEQ